MIPHATKGDRIPRSIALKNEDGTLLGSSISEMVETIKTPIQTTIAIDEMICARNG